MNPVFVQSVLKLISFKVILINKQILTEEKMPAVNESEQPCFLPRPFTICFNNFKSYFCSHSTIIEWGMIFEPSTV